MIIIRFLSILFLQIAATCVLGQNFRYFEFKTICGHGKWQDTSFIAATSDSYLVNKVLLELSKPFNERDFISGKISKGHAGHNRNASHWFPWHFIPNEWDLVEFAIELCDGCPFSDVESDTAYWINVIGMYCPWNGKPKREIYLPNYQEEINTIPPIEIYPNPTKGYVTIEISENCHVNTIQVFDVSGNLLLKTKAQVGINSIRIKPENGMYIIVFEGDAGQISRRVLSY